MRPSFVAILLGTLLLVRTVFGADFYDWADTPRLNYSASAYRLWIPRDVATPLQGVLVLMPGTNGDGRGMAADPGWQQLARDLRFALLAGAVVMEPSSRSYYYQAEGGSGQSLLDGLAALAGEAGHPELAQAPLLLWGASAGGQFAYNFACWQPARVVGFVAVKGGYYDAIPGDAVRAVPGLWFIGERDASYRMANIEALVLKNRKLGARWALAVEPNAGHEEGKTRTVARPFLLAAARLRLAPENEAPPGTLRPLPEASGWTGDLQTGEIAPAADRPAPHAVWLPDEATARAWQQLSAIAPTSPPETAKP